MPLFAHPKFRAEAIGTKTADSSEQTLNEITRTCKGVSGYIDMTNMASGDTVMIRTYAKIKSGGSYIKQGSRALTGGQDPDLLYVIPFPTPVWGFKITLQQTAGTNRTYDYLIFSENE